MIDIRSSASMTKTAIIPVVENHSVNISVSTFWQRFEKFVGRGAFRGGGGHREH